MHSARTRLAGYWCWAWRWPCSPPPSASRAGRPIGRPPITCNDRLTEHWRCREPVSAEASSRLVPRRSRQSMSPLFRTSLWPLLHQRHGTDRRARAAAHLQRQHYEQKLLSLQPLQVAQLLHHRQPTFQEGYVRRLPPLVRMVQPDQISAEQRHLLIDQPLCRLSRDVRTFRLEAFRAPVLVLAGPRDHGCARDDRSTRAPNRRPEVIRRDGLVCPLVGEAQQMTWQNQPL